MASAAIYFTGAALLENIILIRLTENQVATSVLECAFEIHRTLGSGLLESAYQQCLHYDLKYEGF